MRRIRVKIGDTIYYQLSKIEKTRVYESLDDNWVLQVKFINEQFNEEVFDSKDTALKKQAEIDDAIADYRDWVDKVVKEEDDGE